MSELSARLGLYSAIDQAAVGDPERLKLAAQALRLYRLNTEHGREPGDPLGTAGWDRERRSALPDVEVSESVEASLDDMASAAAESETGVSALDQTHRLRAIWAAALVVPSFQDQRDRIETALAPLVESAVEERKIDPDLVPDQLPQPRDLVDLIFDGRWDRAEQWVDMVQEANERTLVSSRVVALAQVGCEDWIIIVPFEHNGGSVTDPVARIVSKVEHFDVGSRTLAQVKAKLQPPKWPGCLKSFWCKMTAIKDPHTGMGTDVLQEKVGDCPTVWFEPYLQFLGRDLRDSTGSVHGFELQYALAQPPVLARLGPNATHPLDQDPQVLVDSGTVRVIWRPGPSSNHHEIDLMTTKSILFSPPLPTGGVALMACVSGWADMTRLMMTGCLATP